ncbi:MAG TPA: hypothetical protein VGK73_06250 [Polyangiaceae bacterium]
MPLLLSEHERFAAVQKSLRELCGALDAGILPPARLDPCALVDELGSVLAAHFETAEISLTRVASRRPDLLPGVVDMRSDHTALSQSMADLRLLVSDQGRWSELSGRIAALLRLLAVHREGETALVRAAEHAATAPGESSGAGTATGRHPEAVRGRT